MSIIKIKVAFNGFVLEVEDSAQIFATTDSLLDWLKENLPKFQGMTPSFDVVPKKGRADG